MMIGACIAAERAQARADHERAEREQQRRFLAMLTHELKTPLAVLRMHLGTGLYVAKSAEYKTAMVRIDAPST